MDADAFCDSGADAEVVVIDWGFWGFVRGLTDCDAFFEGFFSFGDFLIEVGAYFEGGEVVAMFLVAAVGHERYCRFHFAHVGEDLLERGDGERFVVFDPEVIEEAYWFVPHFTAWIGLGWQGAGFEEFGCVPVDV